MKICKSLFFSGLMLISFPLSGWVAPSTHTPKKRALIITIGQYGPHTGWDAIHSENDLPLIRLVAKQLGIPDSEVYVLQDEDATFQHILDALEGLKSQAGSGDFIYLHFSGHGQQKRDHDQDEADGLDEALVPYDSPMRFSTSYQGQRLLTDDHLHDWVQAICPILGPDGGLFITLDACHSGTATRGQGYRRGTTTPMAEESYWRQYRMEGFKEETNSWVYTTESPSTWAPYIVFSASQGNQLNWEYTPPENGKTCGPLSFALQKGIQEYGSEDTFRTLFEHVQQYMQTIAPYQQPQAEGELDTRLFPH